VDGWTEGWVDRWARGETRGVYGSSSLVEKKKEKITLSFISPEKEKYVFIFMKTLLHRKRVNGPLVTTSLSHTHTQTHIHTHTLSLSPSLSHTHTLSHISLSSLKFRSASKKGGALDTQPHTGLHGFVLQISNKTHEPYGRRPTWSRSRRSQWILLQ